MMVNDPIADMLTRIRNGHMAGHRIVAMPSSKLKQEIARILLEKGYIRRYIVLKDDKQGILKVLLKYAGHIPAIQGIIRASKPGRRSYSGSNDLPAVKNGIGISIVSTSKGVMTNEDARSNNVGGEVLCKVW
jgi:small subunit ribosomal protein S8